MPPLSTLSFSPKARPKYPPSVVFLPLPLIFLTLPSPRQALRDNHLPLSACRPVPRPRPTVHSSPLSTLSSFMCPLQTGVALRERGFLGSATLVNPTPTLSFSLVPSSPSSTFCLCDRYKGHSRMGFLRKCPLLDSFHFLMSFSLPHPCRTPTSKTVVCPKFTLFSVEHSSEHTRGRCCNAEGWHKERNGCPSATIIKRGEDKRHSLGQNCLRRGSSALLPCLMAPPLYRP